MSDFTVDLRTIIKNLNDRIQELDSTQKDNALITYNLLKEKMDALENANKIFDDYESIPLNILPDDKDFPSVLSIKLLTGKKKDIAKTLFFYENKFINSSVIPKAGFKVLIDTYVREFVRANGFVFNYPVTDTIKEIDKYLKAPSKSKHKITFEFINDKQRLSVVEALKEHVCKEDQSALDIFLSENQPTKWIRFNLFANQVAELFDRFRKYRIIYDDAHSATKIAQWLEDRIKTLKPGNNKDYFIPTWGALENVLNKESKKPHPKKRILTDILPIKKTGS